MDALEIIRNSNNPQNHDGLTAEQLRRSSDACGEVSVFLVGGGVGLYAISKVFELDNRGIPLMELISGDSTKAVGTSAAIIGSLCFGMSVLRDAQYKQLTDETSFDTNSIDS